MDVLTVTAPVEHRESGLRDLKLLSGLWPYLRRHKKTLLLSFLLLPLIAALEMGQTFLIRFAIDGPIKQGNWPGLLAYAAAFPLLLLVNFALRYRQMSISQQMGQHIIRDLRVDLYRHYQTLSPRFYHRHPQGKLLTRLTADIENLNEMLSTGGLAILADLAMVVGAFIGMLTMNWPLALVTVITMTVLLTLMEVFRTRSRRAYDEIRVHAARLNAFLQESLTGMELVQLYRREAASARHFDRLNRRTLKSGLDSIFFSTSFNALVDFMTVITLALILAFGSLQASRGALTIGALVGFFLFVRKMFEPVEDISEKYSILQSGLASIDKVMALFRETPDIVTPAAPGNATERARGHIVLDAVTFGYPAIAKPSADSATGDSPIVDSPVLNPSSAAVQPVLHGLNLAIRPGETVALVGPSGAGKTTLLKLLMRFYDVTGGAIFLDGVDLRQWELQALRRNIVSIQQDDFLFSRSIAENIALAPPETLTEPDAQARLHRALAQSHADRILARFPEGLNQVLEAGGRNLSAGERQLLLFARAIYHDPAILILDEATSAVDPVSERLVQDAMTDLMRGRTVLIVAHRLSTVRQADRILVLEQGRIVQQGAHPDLIAQPGLYRQLCHYQEQLGLLQGSGT
jgi:ATP-binding cassette subfamily B protein